MTALFHVTQFAILLFSGALAKNLMNAYSVVRHYGYAPTVTRKRYRKEFYAMFWLSVIAGVLALVSIVSAEVM